MVTAPLKILNLMNSNHRRGAEAFAMDLTTALCNLGAEVRSVALSDRDDGAVHQVEALGMGGRSFIRPLRYLVELGRMADVIIGHGGRTLLVGALVQRLSGTPFAYRVIGEPSSWTNGGLRRIRVRWALGRADAIVGYVHVQCDDMARDFGVNPKRIHIIGKGIDVARFTPATAASRVAARRQIGLAEANTGAPVVLYMGALTPQKNVEQVIHAVANVGGVRLLIVGDGPHESVLRDLAGTVGLDATFTGAINDPQAAYSAADVVVLTSRTEGVPTVLLEAALMGLPVVATPVGGIPEAVVEGTTGILVDLDDDAATADAISHAIEHRTEIGAAARAHALATWNIDAVAERWLNLLSELRARREASKQRGLQTVV